MSNKPRIGIVLGSGAARGWAHIGVLRALLEHGIEPHMIAGSSIGALVGAAYCCDQLDALERWITQVTWWDIVRFTDMRLRKGGFIEGRKLMEHLERHVADRSIESLSKPFAVIATELTTGKEIWLQKGSLSDAIRASCALPGLFTPVYYEGQWLVDGGLVNPVPISACRALGADVVIAVNLNGNIAGRHFVRHEEESKDRIHILREYPIVAKLIASVKTHTNHFIQNIGRNGGTPGLFDVLAGSINIMQDRITRSRMAEDPPDVLIEPSLVHLGLLEFDHAKEAIAEGRASVERILPQIKQVIQERA